MLLPDALAETCPDEMSCLFKKVSLRVLTLFSLLPLHIRLLINDPPQSLCNRVKQIQHQSSSLSLTSVIRIHQINSNETSGLSNLAMLSNLTIRITWSEVFLYKASGLTAAQIVAESEVL